jgi:predicted esterase
MQTAWFDIWSYQEFMTCDDEERMLQAVHVVDQLIAEEVDSGISSERIFVGGFSQGMSLIATFLNIGCVIAILAGYLCERKLAGIIGVSGWLPLSHKFPAVGIRLAIADFKMRSDANLETPMLQLNGADDSVVNVKFGEISYLALREMGVNVEFHKIKNMSHNPVLPEALDIIGDWLRGRVIT